jgi:hypothetical protein
MASSLFRRKKNNSSEAVSSELFKTGQDDSKEQLKLEVQQLKEKTKPV